MECQVTAAADQPRNQPCLGIPRDAMDPARTMQSPRSVVHPQHPAEALQGFLALGTDQVRNTPRYIPRRGAQRGTSARWVRSAGRAISRGVEREAPASWRWRPESVLAPLSSASPFLDSSTHASGWTRRRYAAMDGTAHHPGGSARISAPARRSDRGRSASSCLSASRPRNRDAATRAACVKSGWVSAWSPIRRTCR